MEQHGIESGGGQKVELFQSSPLDALKKAMHGTQFLGYETIEVRGAGRGNDRPATSCASRSTKWATHEPIVVVLDKTPFYGESGGQVGDIGEIVGRGIPLRGDRHAREGGVHPARRPSALRRDRDRGPRSPPASMPARRQGIRRAHSATHMLHYALRKHLGEHAQQQGSKVDRDWLRFDFANPPALSAEDVAADRGRSQRRVSSAACRSAGRQMPIAEARKTGAMMLVRRKISRRGARGLDGRFQQGTVRRHAPGEHRAGRACSRSSAKRAWRPARGGSRPSPDRAACEKVRGRGSERWPRPPRCSRCP